MVAQPVFTGNMDETELERDLTELRHPRRWSDHLRKTWILIALGRFNDAILCATLAREAARNDLVGNPRGPAEITVAETVAHLGAHHWAQAEKAILSHLSHYPDDGPAEYLYELALQGQGRLHSINPWMMDQDPAEELASFDARERAVRALRHLGPRTPPPAPAQPPAPKAYRPPPPPQPLPRDEPLLLATLTQVQQDAAADHARWEPWVHAAWLLIALERYAEAVDAVDAARERFYSAIGVPATRSRAEPVFEAACHPEAVAFLALGEWGQVVYAADRGDLQSYGGWTEELTRMAMAGANPDGSGSRVYQDRLAAFDPVQYALRFLRHRASR